MAITLTATAIADIDMNSTPIDDDEFALWVELLGRRIGLRAAHIRKSFLKQCVETRMRKRGSASRDAYFELLKPGKNNQEEWDLLIDLLPLHETRFMRHERSLDLVRDHVLERARATGQASNAITLWSVGCSTGEEVYSLAITALEALKHGGARKRVTVIGGDLSRNSLAIARRGIYNRRQLTNLSPANLASYFDPIDGETYSVKTELRDAVQFLPVNLIDASSDTDHVGLVDVVFCQNVLIYFDTEARENACNRLAEHLLPGGLLILGAGELVRWNHAQMKRAGGDGTLAYQKLSVKV